MPQGWARAETEVASSMIRSTGRTRAPVALDCRRWMSVMIASRPIGSLGRGVRPGFPPGQDRVRSCDRVVLSAAEMSS